MGLSIPITFACGHTATVLITQQAAPVCPCGESRVRSVQARPPRFVGAVRGPYAETQDMAPIAVPLAETRLRLKAPED